MRTRRAKALHMPEVESLDWSAIDWSNEPVLTMDEIDGGILSPLARVRRAISGACGRVDRRLARRKSRRQRADRGWSDSEVWSLDTHLCQRLGSMLASHANQARSHPPELAFEEWVAHLRHASEALLAYDAEDAGRVAEARAALHWAADNLVDLWD